MRGGRAGLGEGVRDVRGGCFGATPKQRCLDQSAPCFLSCTQSSAVRPALELRPAWSCTIALTPHAQPPPAPSCPRSYIWGRGALDTKVTLVRPAAPALRCAVLRWQHSLGWKEQVLLAGRRLGALYQCLPRTPRSVPLILRPCRAPRRSAHRVSKAAAVAECPHTAPPRPALLRPNPRNTTRRHRPPYSRRWRSCCGATSSPAAPSTWPSGTTRRWGAPKASAHFCFCSSLTLYFPFVS